MKFQNGNTHRKGELITNCAQKTSDFPSTFYILEKTQYDEVDSRRQATLHLGPASKQHDFCIDQYV